MHCNSEKKWELGMEESLHCLSGHIAEPQSADNGRFPYVEQVLPTSIMSVYVALVAGIKENKQLIVYFAHKDTYICGKSQPKLTRDENMKSALLMTSESFLSIIEIFDRESF